MNSDLYLILQQHQILLKDVMHFFLSEAIDNQFFQEIKEELDKQNMINYGNKVLIKIGYLSSFDFVLFSSKKRNVVTEIPDSILGMIINLLREKFLIIPNEMFFSGTVQRYKANIDKVKFYHHFNLIEDLLFGFDFIINKYYNSVLKVIIQTYSGDESIGTGFYTKFKGRNLLITNKHVIENAKNIDIRTQNNTNIEYINEPKLSENKDIGMIEIKYENVPFFISNIKPVILEDVITIGYPSIPLSSDNFQVVHKGEINGYIKNYLDNNEYFVFSAKTSSGNSGSPIIGANGMVYGMVSEELFEQEALETKGKLPYYAGITAFDIFNELNMRLP